jgi:hypothetical protein
MVNLTDDDRAEAIDLAAAGVVAGDVVKTAIAEAHIVAQHLYCPNPVPCIGRTGVLVAIPVYLERTREQVGEVKAEYCPQCGARKAVKG